MKDPLEGKEVTYIGVTWNVANDFSDDLLRVDNTELICCVDDCHIAFSILFFSNRSQESTQSQG